jgi:hypothetical protein
MKIQKKEKKKKNIDRLRHLVAKDPGNGDDSERVQNVVLFHSPPPPRKAKDVHRNSNGRERQNPNVSEHATWDSWTKDRTWRRATPC